MLNIPHKYQYPMAIIYRFFIAFILGYICASYLVLDLTLVFYTFLNTAEAIYLAAFISIICFVIFVIFSFIIQSYIKLSIIGFISLLTLYSVSLFLG